MNHLSRPTFAPSRLVLSALVAASLAPSAVASEAPCAGPTPDATFEKAAGYLRSGDMGGLAGCLTPEGRTQLAEMAVFVALPSEPGEAFDRFVELLTSFGLPGLDPVTDEGDDQARIEASRRFGEQLDAVTAGVEELEDPTPLIAQLSDFARGQEGPEWPDLGGLSDLAVEGDAAQATSDGLPLSFSRVDGLWYLDRTPGL